MYGFPEGSAEDASLLGMKGSILCDMTRMGLPVPPGNSSFLFILYSFILSSNMRLLCIGFVVTTEACNLYSANDKRFPDQLIEQMIFGIMAIESATDTTFGGSMDDLERIPLLVSVRCGAPTAVPRDFETVINLGINDRVMGTLLRITNDPRFCYDLYRRFLQVLYMYSIIMSSYI